MKFFRVYTKTVFVMVVVLLVAFAWDLASFIFSYTNDMSYPVPVATLCLFVVYSLLFAWLRKHGDKFEKLMAMNENKSTVINWNSAFAFIQHRMVVKDAKDILNDNARVSIDDIKPYGKVFDFRWNGYQKFLPLSDFDVEVGENWKIYTSKGGLLMFMFVWEMSQTSYCFSNLDLENYFENK